MSLRCGFALAFAVVGCAPVNGVVANSEAGKQMPTLAPAKEGSNPCSGRSGEAEALADLAAGRPVKLYTHVLGGERA